MGNYSLSKLLKEIGINKKDGKSDIEYEISSHEWEYKRQQTKEWTYALDQIDVNFIEKYLRKKKLEKLNK